MVEFSVPPLQEDKEYYGVNNMGFGMHAQFATCLGSLSNNCNGASNVQ